MNITEFKGGCLYIRIDELDIQVTDFDKGVGYITWSTLELILDHAAQNNPEVRLRQSIEVKGELKTDEDYTFQVPNLLDYRGVDDEGFYVELDAL